MTMALGVKAPLDSSVFSAAGGALLLATSANFPFSLDELVLRNKRAESQLVADQPITIDSTSNWGGRELSSPVRSSALNQDCS
jgi:hypothetical protein